MNPLRDNRTIFETWKNYIKHLPKNLVSVETFLEGVEKNNLIRISATCNIWVVL